MTDFDPIRAQREIVAGLAEVHKVVQSRAREAERVFAEAEANAHALMKLERFAADVLAGERRKLNALVEAQEREMRGGGE